MSLRRFSDDMLQWRHAPFAAKDPKPLNPNYWNPKLLPRREAAGFDWAWGLVCFRFAVCLGVPAGKVFRYATCFREPAAIMFTPPRKIRQWGMSPWSKHYPQGEPHRGLSANIRQMIRYPRFFSIGSQP